MGELCIEKYGQQMVTSGTQCWEYDAHKRSGGMSAAAELVVVTNSAGTRWRAESRRCAVFADDEEATRQT